MHVQPTTSSQYPPLSPPLSVSDLIHGQKAYPASSVNTMKLVSFADLLDEQLPSPPATFSQIIEAYEREGKGDVETLKAVLAAKQSEEDRIAKILEIRITLLQMHAHRMGMVPVSSTITSPSSSPMNGRPIHALPATRNRQRSTSPAEMPNMLPSMKLARAHSPPSSMRTCPPPLARLPSSSSLSSVSGVSERLHGRPREFSTSSDAGHVGLSSIASIACRKRAHTSESKKLAPTSSAVYYQSRDKHLLPSPTQPVDQLPWHHRRLTLPTQDEDVSSAHKRLRAEISPSLQRPRCRNGLELLLNALESPDNREM